MKNIVIIGAGPGGLTAGMILTHRGFNVTIIEKNKTVGGRNGELKLGDYSFDIGPTFLHQKFTLDEIFHEAGYNSDEFLDFVRLDPMYRISFPHTNLHPTTNIEQLTQEVAEKFPGNEKGVRQFMDHHHKKFKAIFPCLHRPYLHWWHMLNKNILKAIPYIATPKSVYQELGQYFEDDNLKLAFTFQAKYLGMSPWNCPALFTILPYIEYQYGMYHVQGGLNRISHAMADVFQKNGGTLIKDRSVRKLYQSGKKVTHIKLDNKEIITCDECILNADYAYSMTNLFDEAVVTHPRHKEKEMKKKKFSCSTFMLYLGLDTLYENEPHHNIIIADNYHHNVDEMNTNQKASEDMSIYVRNASITDPSLAPKGHSALYVLVPTVNNQSNLDWNEFSQQYRDMIIRRIEARTGMKDLSSHIVTEKIITPTDWETDMNVFQGAVFNLSHIIKQMLYFRPHNQLSGYKNVYLTGGGTHPGSGLPTIYESGRIAANLISEKYGQPVPQAYASFEL